ncbi:hypothetical protein ACQYAD_11130 [Neobacillus sp. SM06]|uniref:hypothetical protein n=1 Tax=Neobacillus sp. SM06 TaxID=3422492 RepID=UPI003D2AF792
MKTKVSAVFFLVLTLGFMAYLDSPYSFLNRDFTYSASEPVTAVPTPNDQIPSTKQPDTVEKLEKRTKENGYIVETYREYEVYKDSNGNVTKSVPTSKTDTLRYWDYNSMKK